MHWQCCASCVRDAVSLVFCWGGGLVQASFSPLPPIRGRINLEMRGGKLSPALSPVFHGDKTEHGEPVLLRGARAGQGARGGSGTRGSCSLAPKCLGICRNASGAGD